MYELPADIDRFTAWAIALPMRDPFETATSSLDHRRVVVVRVESGEHIGWGEAAPVPGHTPESLETVWADLQRREPLGALAGAALAQATADLHAKQAGLALWRRLGGTTGVAASAAIGLDHNGQPDRQRLEAVVGAGYRHVKLKISPATDPAALSELRNAFPRVTLALDANGSLGVTLTERLRSFDSLGFAYIEQPGAVDDLAGHAELRQELTTPIALDESASSVEAIEQILRTNATDIVNLKAGRFGTIETLDLAKRITAAGLAVRLGGLVETGIGRAHAVALATCREFSVVGDIAGSDLYFDNDLVDPAWRVDAGQLRPHDRPGIGVDVDVAAIERFAFGRFSVG